MTELVDIYLKSLEGVARQFKLFFPGKTTRVVDAANNAHMRQIITKYKEVEFPYFALQITSSAINRDKAVAAKNLQRVGAVGGLNGNKTGRAVFHVVPNTTTLRVVFVTDDVKHLYEFIQRWHIATVTNEMNFILEAAAFDVPINLSLDESLAVPELETEDVGPIFMLETTINVDTYLGEMEQISIVQRTNSSTGPMGAVSGNNNHTAVLKSDLNNTVVT